MRERQRRIEHALDRALAAAHPPVAGLEVGMRYAVLEGGKRIRPLLAYAAGELTGADAAVVDAPAMAVEMIHAYSLVHDDLPCMDNDTLRRGKPTCHVAFGEATALLVGDALQARAFGVLGSSGVPDPGRACCSPRQRVREAWPADRRSISPRRVSRSRSTISSGCIGSKRER